MFFVNQRCADRSVCDITTSNRSRGSLMSLVDGNAYFQKDVHAWNYYFKLFSCQIYLKPYILVVGLTLVVYLNILE